MTAQQTESWMVQGDARHLPLDDASVHLVVTSPPYNAGLPYNGYRDWLSWADYWDGLILPALRECYRVLVEGGRLCLNIANVVRAEAGTGSFQRHRNGVATKIEYRSPAGANGRPWAKLTSSVVWTALEEIGFLPREYLTWLKSEDPQDAGTHSTAWGTWCSARNPVLRAVGEPIYVASKISHAREPGLSDLTATEFKAWTRNVWKIPTSGEDSHTAHPATFPVELARRCIKLYSYVGDVVVDPFAGSGTVCWAAKLSGRTGIGVDLSRAYCEQATRRLATNLLPMPTTPPERHEQLSLESSVQGVKE